jgi:hypothetical protein
MTRYCELCGFMTSGDRILDGPYVCEICLVREKEFLRKRQEEEQQQ